MSRATKAIICSIVIGAILIAAYSLVTPYYSDWRETLLNSEPPERGELISWDDRTMTLHFSDNGQTVTKRFRAGAMKARPSLADDPWPEGIDARWSVFTLAKCPPQDNPHVVFRHLAQSARFPAFPLMSVQRGYYDVTIYIK